MGFWRRGKGAGRAKWITVFALLLLACISAPVLAASTSKSGHGGSYLRVNGHLIGVSDAIALTEDPAGAEPQSAEPQSEPQIEPDEAEPSAEPEEAPSPPTSPVPTDPMLEPIEDGPLHAPSAEEVQQGIEADERAQATKERWLESEEAVRQREESLHAFTDISATEAEGLLPLFFSEQLAALNGDPARLLTNLEVVKPLGTNAALISEGKGEFSLLESSIPIESEVGQDSKQPLDLDLERFGDSFIPKNPLADISLPDSALGSVRLASGVQIGLPAGTDSDAQPVEDVGLLYPESEKDTDTVVAPVAAGVEVFQQLRSPQSPETIRFDVGLPAEARLALTEGGGAAVLSASGEGLVSIPPPWAVDAQGSAVPVKMSIEGHSLLLAVSHRSRDLAYPILVDPPFIEETAPLGNWGPAWNDQYNLWNSPKLIAQAKGGSYSYAANSFGHWVWTTHGGTTYIAQATFSPTTFTLPENCATEQPTNQPHGYAGLYNPSTGGYSGLGLWYGGSSYGGYSTLEDAGGPGVRQAIVGIGAGTSSVKHKCAITFEVSGVTVRQKDPEAPTFNSVEYSGAWTSGESNVAVGTTVSDPGLGVQQIDIHPEGASEAPGEFHDNVGCAGSYSSQCPSSHYHQFVINPVQFQAGETTTKLTARDALGGSGHESTYTLPTRVDRTAPVVDLQGQLATITKEEGKEEKSQDEVGDKDELRFPVYNLEIKATDKGPNGNPATEPSERRSGVKNIKLYLDEKELEVPWTAQGCSGPYYSCAMEKTYPLQLAGLESGEHKLKVVVEDQVGHPQKREIHFKYIPATGMKDEYVMQYFPLPDGSGNEAEEEHPRRPELAVNVMSGNLVYRQKDVDVEGPSVDLEVERFYNSQLPESENTQWGDGWTLAQTPKLEPEEEESGPPNKATMVRTSGLVQTEVGLPTESEEPRFDSKLRALVTKEPDGGYAVEDQSGETDGTLAFNAEGQVEELQTPGAASVEYSYEGENLSEIAVLDPATAGHLPDEFPHFVEPERTPTYLSSFGKEGSGNGQFNTLTDVTIDPTDASLWVADDSNDRIQHFSSAGEYLGQFKSCYDPGSVAVNSAGAVYVACSSAQKIEKFNAKGESLKTLATYGSGEGQVHFPLDLSFDSEGNLWVADTENDRVQEFSSEDKFTKSVSTGSWSRPWGVSVAPGGEIWVAEPGSHRISVFNQKGEVLHRYGSQGAGEGQFAHPSDIEVDPNGYVWVTDAGNGRVELFNEEGNFLGEFGEKGSGDGQFNTQWWLRLAVGENGDVWVSDDANHRVERWRVAKVATTYLSSFGKEGSGNGQFNVLTDVAIDPTDASLWVADDGNDRIQHFSSSGEYLGQFKSCYDPGSVAVNSAGAVYVACSSAQKIEKFNAKGESLKTLATYGSGEGQVHFPLDLSFDSEGNLWVADTENDRVQEFSSEDKFTKSVSTGSWSRPWGVSVAPGGEIWVAEPGSHRISVFNQKGEVLHRYGSQGAGEGQFAHPSDIEVDPNGYVWVTDAGNGRVELFNEEGNFLGEFGEKGSGDGQFNTQWWLRLAVGENGDVWVSDDANHRVERWRVAATPKEAEAQLALEADATVEVNTTSGLVSSVEGEEAGTTSYSHEGDLLTAVEGAESEASYEYDEEFDSDKRLTKVTLPNGTYGEVAYESLGRVESVKIFDATEEAPAAKTTYFEYKDEPTRRTTVRRPKELPIIYDIADDGSVFEWQSEKAPPLLVLSGSLYGAAETPNSIEGGDYELVIEASSPAADIASINVIANGNQLVDEKTCEAPCPEEEDRWVTNTGNWTPGILYLEVIVTDSTDEVSSERFWVNIPYTPPPSEEEVAAPTFEDILHFREEFGLDLDLEGNERKLDNRIFDLIWAWHHPGTEEGEVARATADKWGVPLRAVDAAELEYREWFYNLDAERIDQWVEETKPSSFAGYYIDHKAGGIMHVGFTENQAAQLDNLKTALPLVAGERLQVYPTTPTVSYLSVQEASQSVSSAIESNSTLRELVVNVSEDEAGKSVRVGTPNVAQVESILHEMLGPNAPVTVEYDAGSGSLLGGRFRNEGRMRAGDAILSKFYNVTQPPKQVNGYCTAGFGAKDKAGEHGGQAIWRLFVLTAGHCNEVVEPRVYRSNELNLKTGDEGSWKEIGEVTRNALHHFDPVSSTDAEAIRLHDAGIVPNGIYGWMGKPLATKKAGKARIGDVLCFSGVRTGTPECGYVVARSTHWTPAVGGDGHARGGYWVKFSKGADHGDSGAPVWSLTSIGAPEIGLVTAGRNGSETLVEPLLHPPRLAGVPGILHDQYLAPLSLKLGE